MNNNCQLVVFSDKAYNAIIRETFEWDPVETGGILLGHILDNGCWIVMEVLPPGYGEGREGDNVYHEYGYFEYNRKFVNYLAKSVAEQYEIPLELLGLWHRHPGSMDHFSGTDDGTNTTFAAQNPNGVISGLINIDPQLRMTMYYLAHGVSKYSERPPYQQVEVEVGSDIIPEEFFKLKYYQGQEKDLHPYAPCSNREPRQIGLNHHNVGTGRCTESIDSINQSIKSKQNDNEQLHKTIEDNGEKTHNTSIVDVLLDIIKKNKKIIIILIASIVSVWSFFYIKKSFSEAFHYTKDKVVKHSNDNNQKVKTSKVVEKVKTDSESEGDGSIVNANDKSTEKNEVKQSKKND